MASSSFGATSTFFSSSSFTFFFHLLHGLFLLWRHLHLLLLLLLHLLLLLDHLRQEHRRSGGWGSARLLLLPGHLLSLSRGGGGPLAHLPHLGHLLLPLLSSSSTLPLLLLGWRLLGGRDLHPGPLQPVAHQLTPAHRVDVHGLAVHPLVVVLLPPVEVHLQQPVDHPVDGGDADEPRVHQVRALAFIPTLKPCLQSSLWLKRRSGAA